jgi:xanthine dehydrogenase YagS FAD-binding subunit
LRPFQFLQPRSLDEAVDLLAQSQGARLIAGGSDLLDEVKDGLISPDSVISLSGLPGLAEITVTDHGLRIGAMATISDIGIHTHVAETYPALSQAAAGLATPQIRNVGTLGGNLNQRPRCWYFRNPLTHCLKKGGDKCLALAGNSKYLCITGGDRCFIVHPSDTAVALTAFDASVDLVGPAGRRTMPLEEYFVGPGKNLLRENVLREDEILTAVNIPHPAGVAESGSGTEHRSCYLKAGERESGDFALVSVATALTLSGVDRAGANQGGYITKAAIVMGGVAPVPYRVGEVEEYLRGRYIDEIDPTYAAGLALPSARPMADNGYKVTLARNLVRRAVNQLSTVA